MRQLTAFIKKEWTEQVRTGRLTILLILFVLFGIMNPAVAKLTPWMMSLFADSLADTGMIVTEVTVNALTSWTQFYKNVPMALIVFVLLFSGTLTGEYQKGTLVNMLTKGLGRWKVILAKGLVMVLTWTVCYFLCYGITFAYNVYFWDNSIVPNLFFGPVCLYLAGIWVISLVLLMSSVFGNSSSVLIGTGGVFALAYVAGMIPALKKFVPVKLMDSSGLLLGAAPAGEYTWAVVVTLILSVAGVALAVVCFNRRAV